MGFFNREKKPTSPAAEIVDKKPTTISLVKGKNIMIGIDFSGSMDTKDGDLTDSKSRLKYAEKQTIALAMEASKIDSDGIDVITYSGAPDVQTYWNTDAGTVSDVFKGGTRGSTGTHLAIQTAYERHQAIGSKSTLFLLVTDGVPDSESAVESIIVKIANEVKSPDVFMIAILTVGKLNDSTRNWLLKLDENLGSKTNGVDIVSVQPLCGASFEAVKAAR